MAVSSGGNPKDEKETKESKDVKEEKTAPPKPKPVPTEAELDSMAIHVAKAAQALKSYVAANEFATSVIGKKLDEMKLDDSFKDTIANFKAEATKQYTQWTEGKIDRTEWKQLIDDTVTHVKNNVDDGKATADQKKAKDDAVKKLEEFKSAAILGEQMTQLERSMRNQLASNKQREMQSQIQQEEMQERMKKGTYLEKRWQFTGKLDKDVKEKKEDNTHLSGMSKAGGKLENGFYAATGAHCRIFNNNGMFRPSPPPNIPIMWMLSLTEERAYLKECKNKFGDLLDFMRDHVGERRVQFDYQAHSEAVFCLPELEQMIDMCRERHMSLRFGPFVAQGMSLYKGSAKDLERLERKLQECEQEFLKWEKGIHNDVTPQKSADKLMVERLVDDLAKNDKFSILDPTIEVKAEIKAGKLEKPEDQVRLEKLQDAMKEIETNVAFIKEEMKVNPGNEHIIEFQKKLDETVGKIQGELTKLEGHTKYQQVGKMAEENPYDESKFEAASTTVNSSITSDSGVEMTASKSSVNAPIWSELETKIKDELPKIAALKTTVTELGAEINASVKKTKDATREKNKEEVASMFTSTQTQQSGPRR